MTTFVVSSPSSLYFLVTLMAKDGWMNRCHHEALTSSTRAYLLVSICLPEAEKKEGLGGIFLGLRLFLYLVHRFTLSHL